MKPSTKPNSYELVLLLVESQAIADHIQSLKIPYLWTIATRGYCWKPIWNSKKQAYDFRASPEHLEIRKDIKEKARWAHRIIIATDADPSGEFIAAAIQNYLKSSICFRAYLNDYSRDGIRSLLQKKDLRTTEVGTELLKKKKLAMDSIQRSYGGLGLVSAALYTLHQMALKDFEKTTRVFEQQRYLSMGTWAIADYERPWNTLGFLCEMSSQTRIPMNQLQDNLNSLFTQPVSTFGKNIISYPRTWEQGWYAASWQTLEEQIVRLNPDVTLLPNQLRMFAPDEAAHEALRVTDLHITPEIARPHLTGLQFRMYERLYANTKAALLLQPHLMVEKTIATNTTTDIITAQGFGYMLGKLGAASASRHGELFSLLHDEGWIHITRDQIILTKKTHDFLDEIP